MRIGFRQPSFNGMSAPTRQRKQYNTTARTTAGGALKLPGLCGELPVRSTVALRAVLSTDTLTLRIAPSSMR